MISVLILTRNEQHDLPGALASVAWSDDIHVFDSFSTDRTVGVVREHPGVHLHQRVFDDYATHRNVALTSIPFKNSWIFLLDADERPTRELSEELQQSVLVSPDSISAYRLRRRDFLFGTWLRHAQISPFYIRLVRRGRARYTRAINEVLEVEGNVGDLQHALDHFPFSKGISHWIAKHNLYSTMEAELIHRQEGLRSPSLRTALFGRDFHVRRLHQKAIFYRLPGRPVLKWFYMVLIRGAVLDGGAGLTYATLQSIYEYFIVIKTRELSGKQR